jgi:hypothetical protein
MGACSVEDWICVRRCQEIYSWAQQDAVIAEQWCGPAARNANPYHIALAPELILPHDDWSSAGGTHTVQDCRYGVFTFRDHSVQLDGRIIGHPLHPFLKTLVNEYFDVDAAVEFTAFSVSVAG